MSHGSEAGRVCRVVSPLLNNEKPRSSGGPSSGAFWGCALLWDSARFVNARARQGPYDVRMYSPQEFLGSALPARAG
jgi:hypothetical protein